jgi:hypothetical protein
MHDLDLELDDVVLFELPTQEDVEAFCARIRTRWGGWSDADEDVWLVTAELKGGGDLVPLLHQARALVSELGLPGIRYCLDGRIYVLEAARAPVATERATKSK